MRQEKSEIAKVPKIGWRLVPCRIYPSFLGVLTGRVCGWPKTHDESLASNHHITKMNKMWYHPSLHQCLLTIVVPENASVIPVNDGFKTKQASLQVVQDLVPLQPAWKTQELTWFHKLCIKHVESNPESLHTPVSIHEFNMTSRSKEPRGFHFWDTKEDALNWLNS